MGGKALSGGSKTGAGALLPFSSTKPDDRKSAQEGVVGRLKASPADLDVEFRVAVAELRLLLKESSPVSSKALPNPMSSNLDHEGSFKLVEVDASDT